MARLKNIVKLESKNEFTEKSCSDLPYDFKNKKVAKKKRLFE